MGYKIFYSYQSDIDSNLNKKFIRTAINNAIAKITLYDIEPLIEGFYGKGGNPPLLTSMLEQSSNADIFIGDVTFTMSKVWHNHLDFHEDVNSYLIEIPKGDLKPAPNPNVLLETGYSWALKDFERTILVMNTAFSDPSKLPVDMKGLRHPITYKLDSARAAISSKYQKELDNLTESLQFAIIDAIKSKITYQLDKLRPFKIHSQLLRHHQFPYRSTERYKEKLLTLRDLILNYKGPIRLTGLPKTGKSRLVYEVFLDNYGFPLHEFNEQILYYNFSASNFSDISKAMSILTEKNQPKIIIADNCDLKIHNRIKDEIVNTNLKLISINSVSIGDDSESPNIFINDEEAIELNKLIIKDRFLETGFLVGIDHEEYNIENTVLKIESEENIVSPLKRLYDQIIDDSMKVESIELLSVLNLFDFIGISGKFYKEFEIVKKVFLNHLSNSRLDNLINELVKIDNLKVKGDSVIVIDFISELMNEWWQKNKNSLNDLIAKLEGTGLLNRFVDRLLTLLKDENLIELKKILFDVESILINNEFTDTYEGSELLNKLVTDFPIEVLSLLSKKIE